MNGATNDDVCPHHFIYLLSACFPALPTHPIQFITSCSITHHQPTRSSPNVVHVTETPCYASLANFSYALLVCTHSPRWPTSRTCCSSGLILLAGLPLVPVARLHSFSSRSYISYALLVWPHSPHWPTTRTRCSSALIPFAGLVLVRIARLPLFSLTFI